ncbi:hypothetical protein [Sphingopyxis sp.]|uniref:hypothetical protein n=1 Tax=Sphingopyxis sp. TaxID=1908224 RepID=UPI003D138A8A
MRQVFRIVAVPDPQTLPRIIAIFAQRSLVPTTMSSHRHSAMLHIEIELDHLDPPIAAIIAAKLGEGVLIDSVVCDTLLSLQVA